MLSLFFRFLDFSFYTFKIFQLQFGINDLFITYGVDGAFIPQYIFIFKTTDHMNDGIHFADIAQKFIAKSFSFAGATHQPAISTISICVGTMRLGCTSSASLFNRGSGTSTNPTFGSMVQKR